MKPSFNVWPWGLLTVFGLFFAGLVSVIVIAVTHSENLVSDNYYDQEIGYQGQMEGVARAQQVGASISSSDTTGVVISVPQNQVGAGITGTVMFYRPADPALDHQVTLSPGTDGIQKIDTSKLASGLWRVRAQWTAAGKDYFMQQKVVIAER